MVKLDHDDVAQNADMGSVYDRLAEHFRRDNSSEVRIPSVKHVHKQNPDATWRYVSAAEQAEECRDFNEKLAKLRKHIPGALASDMVAETQDDGWDNDCC